MKNNSLRSYFFVYLGCIIQAFSVNVILKPNNLTVGGFTGLSLALENIIGVRYSIIYYILCLITLIMAFKFLGKVAGLKIILLSLTYPLLLVAFDFLNVFTVVLDDKLLVCIYYGVLTGIGSGLVLREGFSQGSSDTLARITNVLLLPHISIAKILFVIDVAVLFVCGSVFGLNSILYALVMQAVYMKTLDSVLMGMRAQLVKVIIITSKTEEVKKYIKEVLHRGVSLGNNSNDSNSLQLKLISICSTKEAHAMKEYVARIDKEAFINVAPVISVWGKGDGFEPLKQ
ncbi:MULTISPECIES: YitT family protein [Psychrilyobacter]|uniref:DUF2179 domain-containing protein n=1 Tax=Psychrilyobacter piezotolerans TaxID=2293438 RepID=A0ABX9KJH2_9FUSO|nr:MULTISPECIES: YitT family protein [Psychrilyobacter]MCS5422947.1 YitT family protein [Psychrilyobacter sp. S5]NDI77194.1 YitT family protein [Psychrilyobacter piezotolerans]RDE64185.1 DUF2179 domain-containing protein [Psychrilyobacter sp. S5]REI42277.1 DUF2179 domain-containing protein [Psychrilyobacter piezotolerans]